MATGADSSGCSVLVVSSFPEDYETLNGFLGESGWALRSEATLPGAAHRLRENAFHLVLCETDLRPATWKEVLAEIQQLSQPPFLILVSRLADEHLWAEALNLGVYDVLSKPLEKTEVTRVVNMAWLHWKYHHENSRQNPVARGATA